MIKQITLGFGLLLGLAATPAFSFTLNMTGEGAPDGAKVESSDCSNFGEQAFSESAGLTEYTSEHAYTGDKGIKMTIKEGWSGWGSFGGVVTFDKCKDAGGRALKKGDEIWVRLRVYVEEGFEWDPAGRNKFLRVRTFYEDNGKRVTDGFNNLYLNSHEENFGPGPYQFIFSGANHWHTMKGADWSNFIIPGEWKTIEYYLKFDNVKGSEGGDSMVRVWVDGELIGETNDRETMGYDNSLAEQLYIFTWWTNDGAHKTQHIYADDITITSDIPEAMDENGNRYIGMGAPNMLSRPKPPIPVN